MPSRRFFTLLCQLACTWHRWCRKGDTKRPLKQPVITVTLHFPQISFQCEIRTFISISFWGRVFWVKRIAKEQTGKEICSTSFKYWVKFPHRSSHTNIKEESLAQPWAETKTLRKDGCVSAGVCRICRQCLVTAKGEYCSLILKLQKVWGEEALLGKNKFACNYTKVLDWPQWGGVGVTENPECLIKSPPTCGIHQNHPKALRRCRNNHGRNYRATGQAAGGRKQLQIFSKWQIGVSYSIYSIYEACSAVTLARGSCCLQVIITGGLWHRGSAVKGSWKHEASDKAHTQNSSLRSIWACYFLSQKALSPLRGRGPKTLRRHL